MIDRTLTDLEFYFMATFGKWKGSRIKRQDYVENITGLPYQVWMAVRKKMEDRKFITKYGDVTAIGGRAANEGLKKRLLEAYENLPEEEKALLALEGEWDGQGY
jgi:hypothetical protein